MMKLSIDRAVDGAGLEAGVRVAKGYHDGCERANGFQRQSLKKSWRMCIAQPIQLAGILIRLTPRDQ
jgi:hypothetical protein